MGKIFKKFEDIIYDSGTSPLFSFRSFLSMVSKVYGGAVKLRRTVYKKAVFKSKKLPCPTISIGNITVGGTGKTPMTMYMAQVVKQWGYKVVIISRGYKGKAEKVGGIVSDGKVLLMTPEIAGDEPYMMAKKMKDVPVIIGRNRIKAGKLAIGKFDPDVIVLDDGFQHLKLQRDLDVVLLDYHNPFGNGQLLPRGALREPISALLCANAIIMTRSDTTNHNKLSLLLKKFRPHERKIPVYRTFYHPFAYKTNNGAKKISEKKIPEALRESSDCITGRNVFIFSGLADNHSFRETVKNLKCNLSGSMEFPDHHWYSDRDLKNISMAAKRSMSECLVTSEKDYVRISHKIDWPGDLFIVGIEIDFAGDEERFFTYIKDRIKSLHEKA